MEDYAKGFVLPGYRDEYLSKTFTGERLEQMKRIPPEQRQNVMAEISKRCFKKRAEGLAKMVYSPDKACDDILAENGW